MTGWLFVAVFMAAMVMSLARSPLYGLYAYVAVFYLHPPSRWWGGAIPDLRWSFLAAGVTLISILISGVTREKDLWLRATPVRIMLIFVAWFWLSSFWALSYEQHVTEAVMLTKYLLVFYMIYVLVDTPSKAYYFLLAHVIGCFYLGYLGYQSGAAGRLDGVGGPGIDDSNTLGMQLATGVIVGGLLVLHARPMLVVLVGAAVAFSLNGVVLTGSRGAFLALLAGGMATWFLRPKKYARKYLLLAGLGGLAIGVIGSQQFWERMNTVRAVVPESGQEVDLSAESRLVMAEAQLRMAVEYPLGAGHRGSEALSSQYLDPIYMTAGGARSSHNVFLTVLVEQGIPGVLLSLWLIGWVVFAALHIRRSAKYTGDSALQVCVAAVIGALTTVMIGGLFADFAHCEIQIWMFAILAAMKGYVDQVPAEVGCRSRPIQVG